MLGDHPHQNIGDINNEDFDLPLLNIKVILITQLHLNDAV